MPAKMPLPREADGTVDIKAARKRMKGHRTNAEIEERIKTEITTEMPKRIIPPAYLPESMRDEFKRIAKQLGALHIFCPLDYDMLARYLIARAAWLKSQAQANHALTAGDLSESLGWGKSANMYFSQCHACAQALGLSITSRCRLVVPKPPEDETRDDPMTKMLRERAERRRKA